MCCRSMIYPPLDANGQQPALQTYPIHLKCESMHRARCRALLTGPLGRPPHCWLITTVGFGRLFVKTAAVLDCSVLRHAFLELHPTESCDSLSLQHAPTRGPLRGLEMKALAL